MDEAFVKADERNLPKLDLIMILEYFKNSENFNIAETSGWKAKHSMRQSYINTAIGWVEVKRERNICIVKCKICPEHNVRNKLYVVECKINEEVEELVEVKCLGCAASEEGCKHATAFLMWLHEKSSSPSPTQVQCYWKKPTLSRVSSDRVATLANFGKISSPIVPSSNDAVNMFLSELPAINDVLFAESFSHCTSRFSNLNMHIMGLLFKDSEEDLTINQFMIFLQNNVNPVLYKEACKMTVNQSNNPFWHTLRYGRITASILYEVSCAKNNETLKTKILGVSKVPMTAALKRGRNLEEEVREEVYKQLHIKFERTGFLVDEKIPHFGASPDGVSSDSILEIKCPFKETTIQNYVKNNKVTAKVRSQMQLQMKIFKRPKGLLAVADPQFKSNKKIYFVHDDFDNKYVDDLIFKANNYWSTNIFPILID